MSTQPTIYVITHYGLNHNSTGYRDRPMDERFLRGEKNYVYYVVDDIDTEDVPSLLEGKTVLFEKKIDPLLHVAGAKYLAEWSFLLAEYKHSFCAYPMFMISSRFYEKNNNLPSNLDWEWDSIFALLEKYGWGYLPSYDRELSWLSFKDGEPKRTEIPQGEDSTVGQRDYLYGGKRSEDEFRVIRELYGVNIPDDYPFMSDLQCNYIGFATRQNLVEYVEFYLPLLYTWFDHDFKLKCDMSEYIRPSGFYRNEKPLTFYLEWVSHLYFFASQKKFFALHYDGYYEVDEANIQMKKIRNLNVSLSHLYRFKMRQKLRAFKGRLRTAFR